MIRTTIWKPFVVFASLLAALPGAAALDAAKAAPSDNEIVIVAFGDSLSAGYQLPPAAAFPVQLEKALRARGLKVNIVNAGVSGDTATDGLARLDWALPGNAQGVILELGANDALRGIPVEETTKALSALLEGLKARKLEVLIAGMHAPRNWGDAYAGAFTAMYVDLARKYDALLYPFFLEGVALDQSLNLRDGLHPNARGVARIVERILPSVEQLMQRIEAKRAKPS